MRNRLAHRPAGKRTRARAAVAAPAEGAPPDLREFTIDFFRLFGASVATLDRRKQGPVQVQMSGELADFFGREAMVLAFQTAEPGSGHQLVAHGSLTFDRMLAWLELRGALTVRRLPVCHTGSELLMQAVRPLNAGIANLRLQEQQEPIYAFHWRITYRADDKREELYTVVLDEQGVPLHGASVISTPVSTGTGDERGLFERWLADSEALPAEPPDADGLIPAPKLPPMTQLVRLAETARKFAVYHADLRCVAHEAEILPRLYKAVNRLTTYYGQQIEEVRDGNDSAGDKREALESDLARKVAEEVENHRLRVHVDLISYAVVYLPAAVAEMTVTDGRREARLRVRLDRYAGILQRPACYACSQEMERIVLCRNGHACCDGCLRQCATCADVLCASCGTAPCPLCAKENCETCGQSCWACGERACIDHISRCPTCGDNVCHACQSHCAECGERQCRSHLRADAVLDPGGGARLVCGRCAIRCPGCKQYSARTGTCTLSGQRFCANCLVPCSTCGRTVGPGFYSRTGGSDGRIVCRECVVSCPTCGQAALRIAECASCGAGCCEGCGRTCSICGKEYCREHSEIAPGCGHVLCKHDAQTCHIGREAVCPRCNAACAICEQHACTHHQGLCAWCGKLYCSACVHDRSGLCLTCASLMRHGEHVDILAEPCAASADVQALADKHHWKRAQNREMTVYLGGNAVGSVLVVVRQGKGNRQVVVTRKLTARDLVAGAFHL